jgi:hypothetical protein
MSLSLSNGAHPAESASLGIGTQLRSTDTVPTLLPSAESLTELTRVRKGDMDMFAARLERLCERRMPWRSLFALFGSVFLGAAIAGGFGVFALGASHPSNGVQVAYYAIIGACAAIALICGLACWALKQQSTESVRDVRDDLKRWLAAYQQGDALD